MLIVALGHRIFYEIVTVGKFWRHNEACDQILPIERFGAPRHQMYIFQVSYFHIAKKDREKLSETQQLQKCVLRQSLCLSYIKHAVCNQPVNYDI